MSCTVATVHLNKVRSCRPLHLTFLALECTFFVAAILSNRNSAIFFKTLNDQN